MSTIGLFCSQSGLLVKGGRSIHPMFIADGFSYIFQSIPVVLIASFSTSRASRPRFLIGSKTSECKWSRMRMRTLQRDRSRCRGCDTKGDEVTLRIHPIRPDASDLSAMVTLCMRCADLAHEKKLSGMAIPDFLRHLWHHLYHPEQPVEIDLTCSSPPVETAQEPLSAQERV
jgi:5-methylcytosine-specific restriction endonuclease McrA